MTPGRPLAFLEFWLLHHKSIVLLRDELGKSDLQLILRHISEFCSDQPTSVPVDRSHILLRHMLGDFVVREEAPLDLLTLQLEFPEINRLQCRLKGL